jgi:hypothetical protein
MMTCSLGLITSLLASAGDSFVYNAAFSPVLLLLLFAGINSQPIKWYTRKGGRLKADKESSELEKLFRSSDCRILKKMVRGTEQAFRTAGVSGEKIYFLSGVSNFSAAFLVLAMILGDVCASLRGLDIDLGNLSGTWVGRNDRGNQCRGGICHKHSRSKGGGRNQHLRRKCRQLDRKCPTGAGS